MKTIILDDDPTGTQSATDALVLLMSDADTLTDALRDRDAVYVQTNSRALEEAAAVALARRIRADGLAAAARLDDDVRFVLRGDSTLRGHVFAETEVFLGEGAVMVFVPAFPQGGRTTRTGRHYIRTDGVDVPADETEYAHDPVFPFATSVLVDYVAEKSGRSAVPVGLDAVRGGLLAEVLRTAPAGSVVVPDVVDDDDIRLIAAAVDAATAAGAELVVRSASPLAAALAGVASVGLLERPLLPAPRPVLLACGSHTGGATRQLAAVARLWGPPATIVTAEALADPVAAGRRIGESVVAATEDQGLGVIATERDRSSAHGTLDHGERVMTALTTAVRTLLPLVDVVVAKGGITSAEVARVGIGATRGVVIGQVAPGVSVWRMSAHDGREMLYVVVPGNVGGDDVLLDVLDALRVRPPVAVVVDGAGSLA